MHTDMKHKVIISALLTVIPLAIAALIIFFIASGGSFIAFYPLIILLVSFIAMFVLSFVQFMKDHMWLSSLSVIILTVLISLIIHFLI